MYENFATIALWALVAIAFPVASLVLASLLRPSRPNNIKYETYECGIESHGASWVKYNFKFYIFALVFVVFEVESIFLFLWAVVFRQLQLYGFIVMAVFLLVLVIGLVYEWKKRALEWR